MVAVAKLLPQINADGLRYSQIKTGRVLCYSRTSVPHLWNSAFICGEISTLRLNTTVGRESTVNRDDDAGDEAGGIGGQPDCRADQFVRFAEASHGRVVDDLPAARGQAVVGVEQQGAVLFADEEAGGNGVDAHARPMLLGQSMASQRVRLSMADLEAA